MPKKRISSVAIDTVPLPERPVYVGMRPFYIGTWPTPEAPAWDQILMLIEQLDNIAKPVTSVKEISQIVVDFRKKICKALEASIRSDIGCLCKYNRPDVNLCTEPKIRECLTRLVKTAQLYERLCCLR